MPTNSTRDDREFWFLGTYTQIKSSGEITGGGFSLVEQVIPAGFASPYHLHHREDEAFYVVEGEASFVQNGQWTKAGPGGYVYLRCGIPHGFRIDGSSPAKILILCTPAGFENFLIDMSEPLTDRSTPPSTPPDMAKLTTLAAKYEIDILGPLPE